MKPPDKTNSESQQSSPASARKLFSFFLFAGELVVFAIFLWLVFG